MSLRAKALLLVALAFRIVSTKECESSACTEEDVMSLMQTHKLVKHGDERIPNEAEGDNGSGDADAAKESVSGTKNNAMQTLDASTPMQSLDEQGSNCRRSTTPNTGNIIFMFAGREDRTNITMKYLREALRLCLIDAVHVWNTARNIKDAHWVSTLKNEREGIFVYEVPEEGPTYDKDTVRSHNFTKYATSFMKYARDLYRSRTSEKWSKIYMEYARVAERWNPTKGAARPFIPPCSVHPVVAKLDDDIVFMDLQNIRAFFDYIRNAKDEFIVHANVINNGVNAFYQLNHSSELAHKFPILREYPNGTNPEFGRPGAYGKLWENASVAKELEKHFLNLESSMMVDLVSRHALAIPFAWKDSSTPCITFRAPGLKPPAQGRISVNFMGMRLAIFPQLNKYLALEPNDDEHTLTTEATKHGEKECIFVAFAAAHLSFRSQRALDQELLPQWSNFSEEYLRNGRLFAQGIWS